MVVLANVYLVLVSVEIPWRCQQCVHEGFAAVVALGAVIRGETGHYEVVCQQVAYGCQKVMLEHHLPIGFGVLTTENHQQALRRANGEKHDAGAAAVDAVFSLLQSAAPVSV